MFDGVQRTCKAVYKAYQVFLPKQWSCTNRTNRLSISQTLASEVCDVIAHPSTGHNGLDIHSTNEYALELCFFISEGDTATGDYKANRAKTKHRHQEKRNGTGRAVDL